MITRKEFEIILDTWHRYKIALQVKPQDEQAITNEAYYSGLAHGVALGLSGKLLTTEVPDHSGKYPIMRKFTNEEMTDTLFPPAPEPSAPMEREVPYQIMVGGFGEQDVLLARDFLVKEMGGFKMLPPGVITRLQNLLEREAERQKFLAWLEDECDEMSKVPKDIPGLSEYLDKWLCRE